LALEVNLKSFPPPENMEPNVLITVKIPSNIYSDLSQESLKEIKHIIFSAAEQELNIHTIFNVRVAVILLEVRE
jgi:hypothetical protein